MQWWPDTQGGKKHWTVNYTGTQCFIATLLYSFCHETIEYDDRLVDFKFVNYRRGDIVFNHCTSILPSIVLSLKIPAWHWSIFIFLIFSWGYGRIFYINIREGGDIGIEILLVPKSYKNKNIILFFEYLVHCDWLV